MTSATPDPATLRVTLWQHASDLDPAVNREALDRVADLADGADLVVLPEAFARDFGDPGCDLAPYAEPLDGPFGRRLAELASARDVALLAGMFEQSAERTPLQHPGPRRAGPPDDVPQDPSLRLVRLPRVRPPERRADRAR